MKTSLSKVIRRLMGEVSEFSFIAMSICVFLQVVFRYVLHVSAPWTEELARFLLVILVFLGAATASIEGQHLGAFFIRDQVKGRLKLVFLIISCLVTMVFLVVMMIGGIKMIQLTWNTTAITMRFIRMAYLYIMVIIGCLVMLGYAFRDFVFSINRFKTGITTDLKEGLSSPLCKED